MMACVTGPDPAQGAPIAGGHTVRPRRAVANPVFVDGSGRRHDGLRAAAWGTASLVLGFGALMLVALLFGLLGEPGGGWSLLPPVGVVATPAPPSPERPPASAAPAARLPDVRIGQPAPGTTAGPAAAGAPEAPAAVGATAPAVTGPAAAPATSTATVATQPPAASATSTAPVVTQPPAPAITTAPAVTQAPVPSASKPVGSAHSTKRATPTPGGPKR